MPSAAVTAPFRRAFIDHGHVCVETEPGECWYLPNPTPEGRAYECREMLTAVIAAKRVNLQRWKRMNP